MKDLNPFISRAVVDVIESVLEISDNPKKNETGGVI